MEVAETQSSNVTGLPVTFGVSHLLFGFMITRNIISLVIIGANLLTIVAICRFQRLRTPTNYMVASLAVADLVSGLLNPSVLALEYVRSYAAWKGLCLAEETLDVISTAGSVFSILMIAVDRYIHVVRYLTYQDIVTKCRTVVGLVFAWVYIIAASAAFMVLGNHIQSRMRCSWTVFIVKRVYLGMVIPHVVILALTIICLYSAIACFLRKQRRQMVHKRTELGQSGPIGFSRTNRMLAFVVCFYCLATIPATAVSFFVTDTSSPEMVVVQQVAILFWYCNAWINPIFYAWQNPEFRTAFRRLLNLPDKQKIHDTDASSTRMTGLPGYNTARMART